MSNTSPHLSEVTTPEVPGILPEIEHTLRNATESDIPAILELIGSNLDNLLPRGVQELKELLPTIWVVEVGGEIVGTVTLEIYSPKIAEVRTLVVRSDMRGYGFGSDLVKVAVAEAKSRNVYEIMTVTSSPKFFEQLNFGTCLNEKYALFWSGVSK